MKFENIKFGSVLEYEGNILLMYKDNALYDIAGNLVCKVGCMKGCVYFLSFTKYVYGFLLDYTNFIAIYDSFDKSKCLWHKKYILSEFEYSLLEHFGKKYKYIARDKNGNLNLYINEPEKGSSSFDTSELYYEIHEFNDCFEMVAWEDEQASLICDVLNDYS